MISKTDAAAWAERAERLLNIARKAIRDGDADAALMALKEGSESGAKILKRQQDETQEEKS